MVSTTKAPSPISVINKLIRLYFTQDIANPGLAIETVTTVCSSKRVLYYLLAGRKFFVFSFFSHRHTFEERSIAHD